MVASQIFPHIYFPIEITGRELAGHILLGTRLASQGMSVVIGHKKPVKTLIRYATKPGIVYYKGDARIEAFGRRDFAYIGQDPEIGIVYKNYKDHVTNRPTIFRRLNTTSAYFAFGEFDFSFLTETFPEVAPSIYPHGSPRTMLWGKFGDQYYKSEIERIRTRYGHFCLVVSRGGRADRFDKRQHPERKIQIEQAADNLLSRARDIHGATGLTVVVRPHPSESWFAWRKAVHGIPGLYVEKAFDLGAWIRAADFVVQARISTAAFEAWMANTPSIASDAPEMHIGKDGVRTQLVADQLCIPHTVLRKPFDFAGIMERHRTLTVSPIAKKIVEDRIFKLNEDVTLDIANVIHRLTLNPASPESSFALRRSPGERLRNLSSTFTFRKESLGLLAPPPYKRWGLSLSRITNSTQRCAEILGLNGEVCVAPIAPNCFLLERAPS